MSDHWESRGFRRGEEVKGQHIWTKSGRNSSRNAVSLDGAGTHWFMETLRGILDEDGARGSWLP